MDYNEFCQLDITLRDYQQKAKESIFRRWNTVDNILYQMPTGTGKTRLFTSIIRDINVWGLRHNFIFRILIIAHRSELIEQGSCCLSRYRIEHGVLAGTLKNMRDLNKSIQVASIQTITHPANRRLISDFDFDFIIIDEAHHSVARSYQQLWHLCPHSKKLGVTATPWRMNRGGFMNIFEAFIPSMPIKEFILKGWLASYQYYSIPVNSIVVQSINSIREFDIEGDFKTSALIDVVDTMHIRAQLYDSYAKHAFGKKGIIYSISRSHSEHICKQYRSKGVRIENIDSKTPSKIREDIIQTFKNGEIDIIVNVDIFSEGFDCPDIEFIQLARPTRSLVKYIQQVGRGLRKNGDKRCIILDNVGMYVRFGLPDEDRDWKSYFYGEENEISAKKDLYRENLNFQNSVEIGIGEGNEDMVLIQDIILPPSMSNSYTNSSKKEVFQTNSDEAVTDFNFSIVSKPFNFAKYVIEETEEGFYIVNVRTRNRMFLTRLKTMPGGVIMVHKEFDKKTFTIIKALAYSTVNSPSSRIVGTLRKEGLLWKFTAFDKTVSNMTINV
ncbi:DEAD/DEAH box helicase [Prevotella sp.]|uniref:DEAD/DEAH box helicase n=1 Tax=Prevotella sp. TaxID=59823 RepID=UPI00307C3612